MYKRTFIVLFLLLLVSLGYVAWRTYFPDEKVRISRRITKLASLVSISQDDGNFARLAKMERISGFFAEDARIVLMVEQIGKVEVGGRDAIRDYWVQRMPLLRNIKVQFFDFIIDLSQGRDFAKVELTSKIDYEDRWGRSDYLVQEFKFVMKKEGSTWLISKLENAATFD